MRFRKERIQLKPERVNLVPVMDAVFIFIFFLLFSSQFIKIFEIETEAPIVSEVPNNQKLEKDPLNLKVIVESDKSITLKRGIDEIVVGKYNVDNKEDVVKVKTKLLQYRKSFPKEDYLTISPLPSIAYEEIVKVIDLVQTLPDKELGLEVAPGMKKIYKQIVLEPLK